MHNLFSISVQVLIVLDVRVYLGIAFMQTGFILYVYFSYSWQNHDNHRQIVGENYCTQKVSTLLQSSLNGSPCTLIVFDQNNSKRFFEKKY